MDRPRIYAYGTPLVLLLVFVLAFLACVSVPISQSITLFDLDIRQADTEIRTGLWGYCIPDNSRNGLQCSKPQLGWTLKGTFSLDTCPFSPSQAADARICTEALNDLGGLVSSSLTSALLIHIFATILAFLTFFLAAVFVLRPDLHQWMGDRLRSNNNNNNNNEIFTRTISSLFLPLLFTLQLAVQLTLALIMDFIVVLVAKRNATRGNFGTSVSYGSVTWISLVTAMLAWAVFVIQIIESTRDQTKKWRQPLPRNDSLEPGSRLSRTLSMPLTPHYSQSRSVTTPSESENSNELGNSTDQSSASDSQAPRKSTFLFCYGTRGKNSKPPFLSDDCENLPPTWSTPPQHRRFSWEPPDDETDTKSKSTYDEDESLDHSRQSPIYACLPCVKRSKLKPEPPEEIELQDITVSQDGSSSVYSQSTASSQEIHDGALDTDATNISLRNVHVTEPAYFTWANIRRALQEMFTFKENDTNPSGDVLKGEESGVNSENPEAQFPDKHAIQHDVSDDLQPSDDAPNETPEQLDQERASEGNKTVVDDVSSADDQETSGELLQSQTSGEPEDQGRNSGGGNIYEGDANDDRREGEDEPRQTHTDETDSEEGVEVAEQDLSSSPEDNVLEDSAGAEFASEDDNSGQTRSIPEESAYAEEDPVSESAEEVYNESDNNPNLERTTSEERTAAQEKEAGTEVDMEEELESEDNVGTDDHLSPRSEDNNTEESDSEKVVITCREADDQIRPDKNTVKRHSNVEVMQNLPGKPLVCTACGAYIFANKHDES